MTNGGIHAAARRRRLRPAENTHVVYPSWPFDPPTTTALLRALHHAGGRQRQRRMPASRPPRQGHRFVHGRAERCGSARRCGGAGAQSFVACPTICFTARLHHHHLPMRQEQSRFRLVLLAAFSPPDSDHRSCEVRANYDPSRGSAPGGQAHPPNLPGPGAQPKGVGAPHFALCYYATPHTISFGCTSQTGLPGYTFLYLPKTVKR